VPLEVLEAVTVPPAMTAKALDNLAAREHVGEAVVLSTCARTEIYVSASRFHGAVADVRNFLSEWSGLAPEAFGDHLYTYFDEVAVGHLFRVAAGIDSMVLGESEVLGQVLQAWDAARAEQTAGPTMARIFRHALEVGKRARTETGIGRGTTSLSQAAVAFAADRLGELAGRSVLLVGAGEMGLGMAEALAAVDGLGEILVVNRTWSKAMALAERFGGTAVAIKDLPGALVQADVVLSSTFSPGLVIERGDVEAVLDRRAGRPLLIVDIAVPRDVDPGVGRLVGVTRLDMDDLKAFTDAAMADRRREVPAVEEIVVEEVERYLDQVAARAFAPLLGGLHDLGESVRQAELAHYRSRLGNLDARQREAVEALTRGIVAKLLHQPTLAVKQAAVDGRGPEVAEAVRNLFDL
jgi:glutamyl-tRNA reductase